MWNQWRVFLICYLMATQTCFESKGNIIRRNHGVVFVEKGVLEVSRSSWHHTFVVDLNTAPLPKHENIECSPQSTPSPTPTTTPNPNDNKFVLPWATETSVIADRNFHGLRSVCSAFQMYDQRITALRNAIHAELKNIDVTLPEANVTQHASRRRRAIFSFIGDISKSLFGTATETEVNQLNSHIAGIQKMTRLNTGEIHKLGTTLESFVKTENERTQAVLHAVELNNEAISVMQSEFSDIARAINVLHLYGVQTVTILMDILRAIQLEKAALQDLMRGYLPPYLVPISLLQDVLKEVRESVKDTVFRLAFDDPNYYYHLQDILYSRIGKNLFINIKIPLKSDDTTFNLYQVKVFPIAVNIERNESTQLVIKNSFLGISMDERYYIELSTEDYELCQGDKLRRCNHVYTLREVTTMSCPLALFRDDSRGIAEQCETMWKRGSFASQVLQVSPSTYLISTMDRNWIKSCSFSPPTHVEPCELCEIRLPCQCSLRTDSFYIPPVLENCTNTTSIGKKYAVNLPALYNFYKDANLYNLSSSFAMNDPVKMGLPTIHMINTKVRGLLSDAQNKEYKLNSIADQLREGNTLYADETSYFLDNLGLLSNKLVSTTTPILSWIATVVAFIALFVACYGHYRVIMLARSTVALPFLGVNPVSTTTQVSLTNDGILTSEHKDIIAFSHTGVLLFLALCVLGATIMMYRRWKRRRDTARERYSTALKLILYTVDALRVYTMTYVPFEVADLLVEIKGKFTCPVVKMSTIEMTWNFVEIKSAAHKVRIHLPVTIKIPVHDKMFVASFIKNPLAFTIIAENDTKRVLYMWTDGDDEAHEDSTRNHGHNNAAMTDE